MKDRKYNVNALLKVNLLVAGLFLFLFGAAQQDEISFAEWDENDDNQISRSEFVQEFDKYAGNWFAEDEDRRMNDRNDEGLFDDNGEEDEGLIDDDANDEGIFNDSDEQEEMGNEEETMGSEQLQETTEERMEEETDDMQQTIETGESGLKENEAAIFDDTDYYENTYDVWDADDNDLLDENEWYLGYDYSYGDYVVTDFDAVDTDGDGYVDYDEYESSLGNTDLFNEWDVDQDQTLNNNEIARMVFNNWDYDNSNFIEKTEWEEFKDYYLKK